MEETLAKTKKCTACGRRRSIDKFYKRVKNKPWRVTRCKDCLVYIRKKYREENLEEVRRRDRERYQQDEKRRQSCIENVRKARRNPENKIKHREREKKWRERNRLKVRAHSLIWNAIVRGDLVRPKSCPRCGSRTGTIEAHHPDYSKPLEVMWLCTRCHGEEHRRLKEEQRRGNYAPY